jgi:hypothetical protein
MLVVPTYMLVRYESICCKKEENRKRLQQANMSEFTEHRKAEIAFNSSVAVLICLVWVMRKQWILMAKVYNTMKQNFPSRHQIVGMLLLLCDQSSSSKICIFALRLHAAVMVAKEITCDCETEKSLTYVRDTEHTYVGTYTSTHRCRYYVRRMQSLVPETNDVSGSYYY